MTTAVSSKTMFAAVQREVLAVLLDGRHHSITDIAAKTAHKRPLILVHLKELMMDGAVLLENGMYFHKTANQTLSKLKVAPTPTPLQPMSMSDWYEGKGCYAHHNQRSGSCHECAMLQPEPTNGFRDFSGIKDFIVTTAEEMVGEYLGESNRQIIRAKTKEMFESLLSDYRSGAR